MSWIGTRVGAQDAQNTVKARHKVADALRLAEEVRHNEEKSTSGVNPEPPSIRHRLAHVFNMRLPVFITRRRIRRQRL